MKRVTFSIDSLLGLESSNITEYDTKSCPSSSETLCEVPSSSFTSDSQGLSSPESTKGPFCSKCQLHFEYFRVKNHKGECKRKNCRCVTCDFVDKGKCVRGKKKDNVVETESNVPKEFSSTTGMVTNRSLEDILIISYNIQRDLKKLICPSYTSDESEKNGKLLNAIIYLLLKRCNFDALSLKSKLLSAAKIAIEDRNNSINNGIRNNINTVDNNNDDILAFHSSFTSSHSPIDRASVIPCATVSSYSLQSINYISSSSSPKLSTNNVHSPICTTFINLGDFNNGSPLNQQPLYSSSCPMTCPYNPINDPINNQPSSYQPALSCQSLFQESHNHLNLNNLYNYIGSASGAINLSKRLN